MPINETLVKNLAGGGFIAQQRNVMLVGGTVAAARSCMKGSKPQAGAPS